MHGSPTVIGVTPAFDEGYKLPDSSATLYLRREYTRLLAELGAVPIILTPDMPTEYILELCDGIVISGGEDIPAEVYGGEDMRAVLEPMERVMWDLLLIDRCQQRQVPVLGVCYGMQLIALHFGGQLCTDISRDTSHSLNHVGTHHDVEVRSDFLGLSKGERVVVASRHHQAVSVVPEGFTTSCIAPDGVIEAMQGPRVFGTQWHPESDETGKRIYGAFIGMCRQRDRGESVL